MNAQTRIEIVHSQLLIATEAYQQGLLTAAELLRMVRELEVLIAIKPGMIDPNTGLRY